MTLSADETYAQVRWEQEGVNRGIARYREAAQVADPSTLPPGQALLRAVVPPLIEAIRKAQGELEATGRSRPEAWAWLIQLLPPEKLAVLTASHLLRITEGTGGQVLTMARALGQACRLQVEMDRWVKQSLEERKVKREADPTASTWDALASFRTRYPNAYGPDGPGPDPRSAL